MNLKNLNGWRRLWILSSAIYLIFVSFIAVEDFPSKPNTTNMANDSPSNDSIRVQVPAYNTYVDFPKGTDTSIIEKVIKENFPNKHIEPESLIKMRAVFISKMLLTWLVPCLVVYILGLSLHWVYSGFRK